MNWLRCPDGNGVWSPFRGEYTTQIKWCSDLQSWELTVSFEEKVEGFLQPVDWRMPVKSLDDGKTVADILLASIEDARGRIGRTRVRSMRDFTVILAVDDEWGIGKRNELPWRLKRDMARFKRLTTTAKEGLRNAVIMGRKTWESLPPAFSPLPGRLNVVLTRQVDYAVPDTALRLTSLDDALAACAEPAQGIDQVFVIGGGEIYEEAFHHYRCRAIEMTRVSGAFGCDVSVDAGAIEAYYKAVQSERDQDQTADEPQVRYERWERKS